MAPRRSEYYSRPRMPPCNTVYSSNDIFADDDWDRDESPNKWIFSNSILKSNIEI